MKLLLCPDGGTFSSDGLETSLDGQDRAPRMAGHTLEEKESGFLIQDSIGGTAGMAGHILLNVSP